MPTSPGTCAWAEALVRLEQFADAGKALDSYFEKGGLKTTAILRTARSDRSAPRQAGRRRAGARPCSRPGSGCGDAQFTWQGVSGPGGSAPGAGEFRCCPAAGREVRRRAVRPGRGAILRGKMLEAEEAAREAERVGAPTPELFLELACIYSFAIGNRGEKTPVVRYQAEAVSLLEKAMGASRQDGAGAILAEPDRERPASRSNPAPATDGKNWRENMGRNSV